MIEKRKPGRPKGTTKPNPKIRIQMIIRPDQKNGLAKLGGSKWFRDTIDLALKKLDEINQ